MFADLQQLAQHSRVRVFRKITDTDRRSWAERFIKQSRSMKLTGVSLIWVNACAASSRTWLSSCLRTVLISNGIVLSPITVRYSPVDAHVIGFLFEHHHQIHNSLAAQFSKGLCNPFDDGHPQRFIFISRIRVSRFFQ